MEISLWSFPEQEEALAHTASADLPMLGVADLASRLLVDVIGRTPVSRTHKGGAGRDVAALQHQAIWFMAIIAVRALRAAMAVISVGYEEQAIAYTRLIDELQHRSGKVSDDRSGEYATQWLRGKNPGSGAKLTGQEFWELLSGPVHANVRAILDWLAISGDDGDHHVVVAPERRPEGGNATLVYMAAGARDIAVRLAAHGGLEINVARLDQAIVAGQDAYYVPDGETS